MDQFARHFTTSLTDTAVKATDDGAWKHSDRFNVPGISPRVAWYDSAMTSQITLK